MNHEKFDDLIGRMIDDTVSDAELSALSGRIADQPERQAELVSQLETAELLSQAVDELKVDSLFLAAVQSRVDDESFVNRVRTSLSSHADSQAARKYRIIRARVLGSVGLFVAAAIAVACFYILWPVDSSNQITILNLNGPVTLTGDQGRVNEGLFVGQRFAGGTFESLSAEAWVTLEFADGTRITITGRSFLTVSENGQKLLHLRHGRLAADVKRQPPGKPMLIRTPTAELEILGTHFSVDSESEMTKLVVNDGLVRMKRLSDGRVAEVAAAHQAIAAAETLDEMPVERRDEKRYSWIADLKSDSTFGKWVSDFELTAAKLKKAVIAGTMTKDQAFAKFKAASTNRDSESLFAMPILKIKTNGDPQNSQMQLVVLSIARNQAGPVMGTATSRLRVRGQVKSACDVTFGLTSDGSSGGFGGKYSVTRSLQPAQLDGGLFEVSIPLSEFKSSQPPSANGDVDHELLDCWIFTRNQKTKLQIIEVELSGSEYP